MYSSDVPSTLEGRSFDWNNPFLISGGLIFLVVIVFLIAGLGNEFRVTTSKGCEIADWARNIAEGKGFFPNVKWLGEVNQPPDSENLNRIRGHYPPLLPILYSIPVLLPGNESYHVLFLSLILFSVLPLWIFWNLRESDLGYSTVLTSAVLVVLFPPILKAAFQPDGEILLALSGAFALHSIFLARTAWDYLWVGLLCGTVLNISLDAICLPLMAGCFLVLQNGSLREKTSQFLALFCGCIPGAFFLGLFVLAGTPSQSTWMDVLRGLLLLGAEPDLGFQRMPIHPAMVPLPAGPGGPLGLLLDGFIQHSSAALASAPFWCWGILCIGLLTGRKFLQQRIAIALIGWLTLWFFRAARSGETTDAFLLLSVWLILLSLETLVRVLEVLSKHQRLSSETRTAVIFVLLLATWWPGFYQLRQLRADFHPAQAQLEERWASHIRQTIPEDTLILSDTPEQLAWKTGCNTAWLPSTPETLSNLSLNQENIAVVLSGAMEGLPGVDPAWTDLFEKGQAINGFDEVLLDAETYCQIWRRSLPR